MRPSNRLIALAALALAPLLLAALDRRMAAFGLALDGALMLLFLADHRLAPGPREVSVRRIAPDKLSLGAENLIRLAVRNLGRRRASLVLLDDAPPGFAGDPGPHALRVDPGREAEVRYHLVPNRRGDHAFGDVFCRARGPLGLAERVFRAEASARAKVYPNLNAVEAFKLLARHRHLEEMGLHLVRRRGGGTEFEKLRPYVPDDEYRKVNWKATARRQSPITNVFETERAQSVLVLIDAGRQMATEVGSLSKLDHAINAALLLAYVASRHDDRVGLATFNHRVTSFLAPRKGKAQHRRFLESLYKTEPELVYANYRAVFRDLSSRWKKRSLVILFTEVLDPEAARDLVDAIPLFRPTHLPLVVLLADPALEEIAERVPVRAEDLYEKVVAREVLRERARYASDLRHRGVLVLESRPKEFSAAVVSKYLEVKAGAAL